MMMVMPVAEDMEQGAGQQQHVWGRRQDMSRVIPEQVRTNSSQRYAGSKADPGSEKRTKAWHVHLASMRSMKYYYILVTSGRVD